MLAFPLFTKDTHMKKQLFAIAATILFMPAFSHADKAPEGLMPLETIDGYKVYLTDEKQPSKLIFIDGGKKEGKFLTISVNALEESGAGFAVMPAKNWNEYMENIQFAREYLAHCGSGKLIDVLTDTSKELSNYSPIHTMGYNIACEWLK